MNGWETMPGRDRIWLGLNTTVFVSTADPSGVETVREVLRATAQADPGCALFRTAHPQRPDAWRPAADAEEALARAEALVVEALPGRDREAAAEAARAFVAAGTTGPTVRVFAHETTDGGAGLVGFTIPHAWGDAMTVLGILRTLVSGPDPDGRLWTHAGAGVDRPLAAALRHRFGSLAALRTVPAARRAAVTSTSGLCTVSVRWSSEPMSRTITATDACEDGVVTQTSATSPSRSVTSRGGSTRSTRTHAKDRSAEPPRAGRAGHCGRRARAAVAEPAASARSGRPASMAACTAPCTDAGSVASAGCSRTALTRFPRAAAPRGR
ncbi:hypothetical protein [Kineosporia sp. A_224]|uniref:hypothetical protein n=1 Tax=Kineosporia sp. A_224 TaxID=1962180 RepID=UPI000B4AE4FF|nr:hypothetical protein [Kineosporia sp. A_224]